MSRTGSPARTAAAAVLLLVPAVLAAGPAQGQQRGQLVWDVSRQCFRAPGASAGSCGRSFDVGERSFSGGRPAVAAEETAEADAPSDAEIARLRDLGTNAGLTRLQNLDLLLLEALSRSQGVELRPVGEDEPQ